MHAYMCMRAIRGVGEATGAIIGHPHSRSLIAPPTRVLAHSAPVHQSQIPKLKYGKMDEGRLHRVVDICG